MEQTRGPSARRRQCRTIFTVFTEFPAAASSDSKSICLHRLLVIKAVRRVMSLRSARLLAALPTKFLTSSLALQRERFCKRSADKRGRASMASRLKQR